MFFLAIGLPVCATGCRQTAPAHRRFSWELAQSVALNAAKQWNLQLQAASAIPDDLLSPLCPEYDLVFVRTIEQWQRLCNATALTETGTLQRRDFDRGSVIGLVARLGRPANDSWPVDIEEIRLDEGRGWVRFRFHGGVYYPVLTGPYLTATYVDGLREPRIVEINSRTFTITE